MGTTALHGTVISQYIVLDYDTDAEVDAVYGSGGTVGDVIAAIVIPGDAVLTDISIQGGLLDDDATPTLALDVGYETNLVPWSSWFVDNLVIDATTGFSWRYSGDGGSGSLTTKTFFPLDLLDGSDPYDEYSFEIRLAATAASPNSASLTYGVSYFSQT